MQSKDTLLGGIVITCVILGFHNSTLKILLSRYKGEERWLLPGGFVGQDEDVDTAAYYILKKRTNIEHIYYKQFYLFGKSKRYTPEESRKLLQNLEMDSLDDHWYMKRSVSVGYYALVKHDRVFIEQKDTMDTEWFDINEMPALYGDHREIIEKSRKSIRNQLGHIPLGFELLSEEFTMPDLRIVYEGIVGHELDRRNFQRKMLSIGLIKRIEDKEAEICKSPYLYTFKREKYRIASELGSQLMIWNIQ